MSRSGGRRVARVSMDGRALTRPQYDNKIVLTRVGDRLSANGEAYWPGKSIMPANEGEFSGTAAPSGRRLHFATDAPDP